MPSKHTQLPSALAGTPLLPVARGGAPSRNYGPTGTTPRLPQSVLQPPEPIHPIPLSTHCQPCHIPMYPRCPRVVPTLF